MHGPTFMANPLACAIAIESLRMLNEQDMASRLAHIESEIRRHIAPAASLPGVREVRVIGSIGIIEMKEPVDTAEFQRKCTDRGIWVRPFGRNAYVMPPYIISDDDLKYLIEQTIECLR